MYGIQVTFRDLLEVYNNRDLMRLEELIEMRKSAERKG
jgi:hypothetical protein